MVLFVTQCSISKFVECEAPTCNNIPGGVVVPAGDNECCPTCGCRLGNKIYRVGKSFSAPDGCNTWYECIKPAGFIVMYIIYIVSMIMPIA